jgi:hypothetical protein
LGHGFAAGSRPKVDDPREPSGLLLQQLRSRPEGLSSREAQRRLAAYGRKTLTYRLMLWKGGSAMNGDTREFIAAASPRTRTRLRARGRAGRGELSRAK